MDTLSQLAHFEQRIDELHDFARTYLRDRGVADGLAARVAHEVSKALHAMPSWHSSAVGRQLMVVWLFRALVDGGHRSDSARLIGDLLRELSQRQMNQGTTRLEH
jgi:hypothetical protein